MKFNDIIRSWKRIPYFINVYVEENDKEECDKNIDYTLEVFNKYIKESELHELIHCYIFRLFKIPSMIVYSMKYKSSSTLCWALCRPLISGGILKSTISDTLHFLWDLLSDIFVSFHNLGLKEIHIRSPIELIKSYIYGFLSSMKFGNEHINKYNSSFDEIKVSIYKIFIYDINIFNKGVYLR